MKTTKIFLCLALVMTMLYSCRQEDDYIQKYAGNDSITMTETGKSFSNEFDALWNAINTNYVAWEVETVNWDETYEKYYPKFVELDTLMAHDQEVPDSQLTNLYKEILDTLHDGHCTYLVKNLYTGKYISIHPQQDRNQCRFGANADVTVPYDLSYYVNLDNESQRFTSKIGTTSCRKILRNRTDKGVENIKKAVEKGIISKEHGKDEIDRINKLWHIQDSVENARNCKWNYQKMQLEDSLVSRYNILAAELFDARMQQYTSQVENHLQVMSAVSADGIAYMRMSNFFMTPILSQSDDDFKKMSDSDKEIYSQIKEAWKYWFDSIQELYNAGKLKGVIIDVRGNGGGYNDDQEYVVGALMAKGGYKIGTYKTKIGTGRLDYSVDYDYIGKTMEDDHAIITNQPIVMLCDHKSVSNSEMSSQWVKQLPNGVVIGSQTHGGLSCIRPGDSNYSFTYGGEFGVKGETPIYGYQPFTLISYKEYGHLEGIGVTPNINVEYDSNLYQTTGRDNQLDAALDYIRTH